MKKLSYLLVLLSFAFCGQTFAKGMQFGDQDQLIKLQDVEIKTPDGQGLYLAHLLTTKFFLAGVNITDKGYVLAVKTDSEEQQYYALTSPQIKELQAEGSLPDPMPPYKISTLDYVIGYSLWLIILVLSAFSGIKKLFKKKDKAPIQETATDL